ncbi:MAG: hypothetical protein IPM22_18000 [Betaproteobacteria bacterium]|nr:hypothetical protein [Betaproteobacteria bacterium]
MIATCAPLIAAVRTNCHISDARHAREMTMCTYLLEMRELFRWERGLPLGAPVPQRDVGAWMTEREALWVQLEDAPHVPLPLPDRAVDPYAVDDANRALSPHGLVYGAGIGRFGKPQFFVADLARAERRDGLTVLVAGREYARDLSAAPAASRGGTIYVRLESLQRWLWERAEAWLGKCNEGALKAALDGYGFAEDRHAAIARMAEAEAETLILHEIGEGRAGALLGPEWERMLAGLARRRTELFVRAVRDHLADCLVTLPALLDRGAGPSLHFWFANLQGLRLQLFPRIGHAYARWCASEDAPLRAAIADGAEHWQRVARGALALHAGAESAAEDALDALAADRHTAF